MGVGTLVSTDQRAMQQSTSPQPALGISKNVAENTLRDGFFGKPFMSGPSLKRTTVLLTLSRNNVKALVGLLTKYIKFRKYLYVVEFAAYQQFSQFGQCQARLQDFREVPLQLN